MTTAEFNLLVDDAADALYRYALGIVRREDEAADVVQDAFERLWLNRSKVQPGKARSYLFSTAHNRSIDQLRRKRPTDEVMPHHVHSEDEAPHDLQAWLQRGLATLPADQRSALLLRDYEGYSYNEISDLTGLSLDQVKVYIFRARKALRAFIGEIENLV